MPPEFAITLTGEEAGQLRELTARQRESLDETPRRTAGEGIPF